MKKLVGLILGLLSVMSSPLASAPMGLQREELSAALLRVEKDPNSEFMLSLWQAGEGLPVGVIDALEQTPDGYLWLGTHQGLVRFDGLRFQSFFTTPVGQRYGTRVGPLEVDGEGRLWLAPDQVGLFCLEGGQFKEVLTNGMVLRGRVESLSDDGAGGLLWVDDAGRLGRIETGRKSTIRNPQPGTDPSKLEGNELRVLAGDCQAKRVKGRAFGASRWVRDFQGKLWLVNPRSIRLYEEGNWHEADPVGGALLAAAPRRQGGLWVASSGKLRWLQSDGQDHEEAALPWAAETRVICLLEDSHRRVWLGTASQGLYCYAAGRFQQAVPTASSILCLLEDQQGNLWAGTRGAGLVRVRPRQFFVHDLRSGLASEFVRSLCEDPAGRLWMVSAEAGLGYCQNGSWYPVGQAEGWSELDAVSIFPARAGGVWISTVPRGLWRWSEGQSRKFDWGPEGPREPAVDLLEDRQGRLWMVTDNSGLFCLEKEQVRGYSTAQGLPSQRMRRLIEDETGQLWAGDWEGAIARLGGKDWEVVRQSSGHRDAVRSMVACEGALWIGTSAGGLLRLKGGQTARISVEQGLPDASIQQLLLDGRGWLWGGTPHRLFRVSLEQLNALADGRREGIEAITYGPSDGLPGVSFANWCDPRCWRAHNGELWFATANGAVHFQPAHLPQSQPPQVVLEEMLLDGKAVARSALQHLRPGAGRLEFRFTAPCLTAPERVRFRYQLSGTDWVEADTTRSVTYASLPAGEHVFRVVACSPDGVWGTRAAEVKLAVYPYFWQTNWFVMLLAAGTAGGGVWLVRRATVRRLHLRLERLRHEHALERERARIAQDLHDELGTNLTSIGLLADMGLRHKGDGAVLTRELKQIGQTARESATAMDAIVWALNPRNDSLDQFANYLAQFTREFFRPTGLRTRLELPPELPAHTMGPETRHQLLLIVKECFNNVVRHAQASEVRLELACGPESLRLSVADNGQGLPARGPAAGQDGLANLRERIEKLGGSLCLESEPGRGTRLDFVWPLAKLH